MLKLHIINYLMDRESSAGQVGGKITGWSLAWMYNKYEIPKATFYRHLNEMIEQGWVVRQKRGYYVLSQAFRKKANKLSPAGEVRV